jgi:hypothetical protein
MDTTDKQVYVDYGVLDRKIAHHHPYPARTIGWYWQAS